MRKLKLWIWPGIAAVGCLTALAIWFEAARVQTDLTKRTYEMLGQGHAWAQVSIKGRDLTLSGIAPDEDSQARALAIVRDVYGVRVASDVSTLLPEEKPYRLTISKTADGVSLSGFVPNESTRSNIIAMITRMLPGIALADQMRLARGAPEGLVALAGYGLAAFPRFSTGSVEISDRTLSISGQALDPEDHEIALAAVAAIPDSAGVVGSVDITPAAVSGEYTWSAEIAPDGLKLEGYAPDASTRAAILSIANTFTPDVTVDDQMRLASGVPGGMEWEGAAEEALSILSEFSEGRAIVRGKVLDLAGEARDADAFRRVEAALSAGFSSGLVLGAADIGVANANAGVLEWTAQRSSNGLSLKGSLPREAARARLLDIAGLKFGQVKIDDTQDIAARAPEGFEAAALVALQALSRLVEAEARIVGGTVFVQGIALNETASQYVVKLLNDEMPEGFTAKTDLEMAATPDSVLPAAVCQEELNRLAAQNTVLFETGEAAIQDHSYGFLDRIAYAALKCGDVRLEISGHTDSDGSEADNLALSERRAQAVLEFMVAAGVSADRMEAIGYGESRPLESNETDADKAANRRIGFRVVD